MAAADILDYEADDIEMDEEEQGVQQVKESARRKKGRGFAGEGATRTEIKHYEGIDRTEEDVGPQKSVEGWILFVSGVHEEASEEELRDKFSEFGAIKNFHLNLDRRTGFIKGYALVEFEKRSEAEAAKAEMDDSDLLGQRIRVGWGFVNPKKGKRDARRRRR